MNPGSTSGPDPRDAWKASRDQALDAWSKSMADFVNTDAFAQGLGAYLENSLAASSQFQKVFDQYMKTSLAAFNMPSREEVTTLAQRLTSVEMRLDDLAFAVAQVNRQQQSPQPQQASGEVSELQSELRRLNQQLAQVLAGAASTAQPPAQPAPAAESTAPRRKSRRSPKQA